MTLLAEMREAAFYNNIPRIKEILQNKDLDKSQRDASGQTPMHYAAEQGHQEALQLLLDAGYEIDVEGIYSTPLARALANGRLNCAELLIKAGAKLIMKDAWGRTGLSMAIASDNIQCLELLLKAGVDVNTRGEHGKTALHNAMPIQNKKEIFQLLLSYGANPTMIDYRYGNTGFSAVAAAINDDWDDVVEILIDLGVPVNQKDERGTTALHWAILNNKPHIVLLLLQKGANSEIQDDDGRTPTDWAKEQKKIEVLAILNKFKVNQAIQSPPLGFFFNQPSAMQANTSVTQGYCIIS